MSSFLEELTNFFPRPLSAVILDYSHLPRKLKFVHAIPFERNFPTRHDAPIKKMESDENKSVIRFYYRHSPGSKAFKYPHTYMNLYFIEQASLVQLEIKEDALPKEGWNNLIFSYNVPHMSIRSSLFPGFLLAFHSLDIHVLSLGGFCSFQSYLYVLDTWKGIIQVYEIQTESRYLSPSPLKRIDISKSIFQSRYFHTIAVHSNVIVTSGGDSLFIFDHFGTEIIVFDFPKKDPAFVLIDCSLFITVNNSFQKYQLE
jgi:hypothetical protein